jgi:hypothetical protein
MRGRIYTTILGLGDKKIGKIFFLLGNFGAKATKRYNTKATKSYKMLHGSIE